MSSAGPCGVGRDLVDVGEHALAESLQCDRVQVTEDPPVGLVDDARHEDGIQPAPEQPMCSGRVETIDRTR